MGSSVGVRRYAIAVGLAATTLATGCSGPIFRYGQREAPDAGSDELVADKLEPRPIVQAVVAPRVISGGTLLVLTRTPGLVAVADSDRDELSIVDVNQAQLIHRNLLAPGDEPGRLVEDGAGLVHVVLRGGGAIGTLSPNSDEPITRREVCPAPRGIAWDSATDLLHVACAGGELVSLRAAGGGPVRTLRLHPDLRDVVVDGDHLLVSTLRDASVAVVTAQGSVGQRVRPAIQKDGRGGEWSATGGYRLIALPTGGALLLHQAALTSSVTDRAGDPYYGGWGVVTNGIVATTASVFRADEEPAAFGLLAAAPVTLDAALSPDGKEIALVSPATRFGEGPFAPPLQRLQVFPVGAWASAQRLDTVNGRALAVRQVPAATGQLVAVAYADDGTILVQSLSLIHI